MAETEIAHPTRGLQSIHWRPMSAVARSQSPFSFKQQVYNWQGQARQVDITLAPMPRERAVLWQAFFFRLNGIEGTFVLSDTVALVPLGVATGTPVTAAGNVAGAASLFTDGWTASQTGIVKAGDLLGIDGRLYTTLVDANSDGSGLATITIWPNIPQTVWSNGTAISVRPAEATFRLLEMPEFPNWSNSTEHMTEQFTFGAEEVV